MQNHRVFSDRTAAGKLLIDPLREHVDGDTIVLGIPGGGVVVGAAIASGLALPLGYVQVDPVARASRRRSAAARMRAQLSNARSMFDGSGAAASQTALSGEALWGATVPDVEGKTVFIVDDGLHDDLEVHRTVLAFRGRKARKLVLVSPFMTQTTADHHSSEVDEVVTLERPDAIENARKWYDDPTSPTTDYIQALLGTARIDVVEETALVYQNILVPVDFSDPAGRALREAVRLARAGGGHITLLYVGQEAERGRLQDFSAPFSDEEMVFFFAIRQGEARAQIIEVAHSGDFDLIVMGTHGRKGLQKAVFGSVTEQVIRDSLVPVLVTR